MQMRKAAGFSNRDKFADLIGVNRHTYKSWETGASMMNLEQAYNCAIALGCTLNDLVGMDSNGRPLSKDEDYLVDTYRAVTVHGKKAMLSNTRAVGMDYMPKSDTGELSEARSA